MSTRKIPVIAAIPNYNMAESLRSLLPALLKQGYDHIYVLDDASTDYSSDVVALFEGKVTFVKSRINGGAGAARNMILDAVKDPVIIHFLDADIQLDTPNSAATAHTLFSGKEDIGFIGGLVRTSDGKQSYWNYGERQGAQTMISSWGQSFLESFGAKHLQFEQFIRHHHLWPGLQSRPNPTIAPERTSTFWVSEANFMIRSDVFRKLGGFDPTIREHDIQTLAMNAQRAGYINFFDPSICVTHLRVNVRKYFRPLAIINTELYLAKKYGIKNWLLAGAHHNK
jgi:GT2 family glycosyltransferase